MSKFDVYVDIYDRPENDMNSVTIYYEEAEIHYYDDDCIFQLTEFPGNCGAGVAWGLEYRTDGKQKHNILDGMVIAIHEAALRYNWGKVLFSDNLTNKKRVLSWHDLAARLGAMRGSVRTNPNHDNKTSIVIWEYDIPKKYKSLAKR